MDLSSFTNKIDYAKIKKLLYTNALTFDINGVKVPVQDGQVLSNKINQASALGSKGLKVLDYYAPSKVAMDTFSQLGFEIDKSIQSSFLLQTFNIKGTDLLCATFCFLISLMSCSARSALYDTLFNINKGAQAINAGVRGINNLVDTYNASITSVNSISNNIKNIFNNTDTDSSLNIPEAVSTLIAVPTSITQNAQLILNALKFGMNFKFMMPDFTGKGIWDLAQNVLFCLQAMALQVADEALNNILAPVEDLINDINPSNCFNNMADRVRTLILQTIQSLQSRILAEIADLFASNNGFNIKFRMINKRVGWSLELMGFSEALKYISANFLEIAKGCGLTPCTSNAISPEQLLPSDIGNLDAVTDDVNPFGYTLPSIPTYNIDTYVNPDNLDDIANKFEDFMSPDNIKIDDNSIKSTYFIDNNAPEQIKDFINDGLLNNILDSSYNIDLNNATITYTYNKKCGENN